MMATTDRSTGRRLPWLLSLVFCALVGIPMLAMLLGVRPQLPDNRAATAVPEAGELAALDTGAFERAQQAFRDRLPGLDWAVRLDAQLELRLTGRSPNPKVVLGRDDWLFLDETVSRPCLSRADRDDLIDTIDRLRQAAAAARLRLVVVIAPDKAAIRPDRLRPEDLARSCAARDIDTIAADLAGPDVLVPAELLREQVAGGAQAYHSRDTHWDYDSAALVVTEVVRRLGLDVPDLQRQETGQRGTIGDLAEMQGLASSGPFRCFHVRRPGVTLVGQEDDCRWSASSAIRLTATSTGPRLLGPVVFQLDSFGLPMLDVIGPWFSSTTAFYKDGGSDEQLRDALDGAETLVVEIVQRTLFAEVGRDPVERLVRALQAIAAASPS